MNNRWVKVFVTWLAVIIIALGGGFFTTHIGIGREFGIMSYEIVMFAVLFLLNRLWLHQTVYLKPTECSWRLIPLNWVAIVLLAQAILLLFNSSGNLALGVTMLLFVGPTEEYVFRGLLLPLASQLGHGRNQLWTGVLVSSVLFGLAHGVNAVHQPVMATVVQMLSAIYLRTGSLLFPIILHGLNDFVPSFHNNTVQESSNIVNFTEIAPILLFLVVGIFMLRKSKRATIKHVIPQL
ncbi:MULTISPECIES: CPBP family intramembrane glutamic endopeptidase [Furfurilactobacillus]|uniref:CPBP family intramembrane metalloprotease n=1 Tax=Furfurilactobacillus rossiae TaxID=231049 RepID=A0A7C9IUG8_9LACO|nr:CPBP family intramembrane glutamic endopeptidase [Furfurilactobacillus milii]MYV05694.1 CPBP family intramembrane metalloprotease [Furfurilactobacillus milii]